MLCNTCVCEKEVVSAKCWILIWWQRCDLEVNPTCLHSKLLNSMILWSMAGLRMFMHFQQLSTSPSTCCFPMGFFFAHIGFHMFHFSFISYLWDKAFISKTSKRWKLHGQTYNFSPRCESSLDSPPTSLQKPLPPRTSTMQTSWR